MRLSNLALAAALSSLASANPSAASHVLHEKRDGIPTSWTRKYKAEPQAVLPVRIGMTQSNVEMGHDLLMDVSNHESPNYGKYYTAEQIHDLFAPSQDSVDALKAWLEGAGIAKDRVTQSVNRQWLQLDATVAELERLVKAEYHVYEHGESGVKHTACDEYHLPEAVAAHVDYITPGIKLFHPTSRNSKDAAASAAVEKRAASRLQPPLIEPLPAPFPEIQQKNKGSGRLAQCDSVMTPACIKALYGIPKADKAAPGNEMGIYENLAQYYAQQDLNLFFEAVFPRIPQGTHPIPRLIDGAIASTSVSQAGAEADLDFQISYPIIYPQQTVLFQDDDPVYEADYEYIGFANTFLDAIDGSYCSLKAFGITGDSPYDPQYPDKQPGGYKGKLQCGVYEPTNVISISYGGSEGDQPINYQKRQCLEFMKLGLQGVSIVASSGDYGVGSYAGDVNVNGCYGGPNGTIFNPESFSLCPYISSIGGTILPPGGKAGKTAEVAVTRFASGGGFSNIFTSAQAPWQQSAVNEFLDKYPPPYPSYTTKNNASVGANGGRFNAAGRGYPDFAAVGDHVLIYYRGNPVMIGGTSASAPAFGAVLTRINEERLAANKSTIGFINPILYAHPEVFNDVTVGNNPNCNSNGFSAAPGWDPVTGLGTPNYPKMLELFMAQP